MADQLIDTQQAVFSNSKVATNMPFFDGTTLAFCQSTAPVKVNIKATGTIFESMRRNKVLAEQLKNIPRSRQISYRAWKLAYCNWADKAVRPISTGLPAHVTERSPSFYREGDRVHFSFIAGAPISAGFYYQLYTCSGPDLDHLDTPQPLSKPPLFFGFVSPHHICWGAKNIVQLSEKATGKVFQLKTSFLRVASTTFVADDPSKLLVTGIIDKEYRSQAVLYDLATGSVRDVSVGGPVYKSSLHGNHLVFARKQKEGFENRDLYHGDCTFSPSAIQIFKGE